MRYTIHMTCVTVTSVGVGVLYHRYCSNDSWCVCFGGSIILVSCTKR